MQSYNQPLYDQESNQHFHNPKQHNSRHLISQPNQNSASLPPPEFKIPQVQYLNQFDSAINFKTQTLKLMQANAILTELIKQTLVEKYNLTEKIIDISQKIRKMENPHSINPQINPSNQNIQQSSLPQNSMSISGIMGQIQK